MATITIPTPNLSGLMGGLSGKKTYLTLAAGAAVIAANHFDLLPSGYVSLDPKDWLNDEYKLIIGAVFRSAMTATGPAVQKGP